MFSDQVEKEAIPARGVCESQPEECVIQFECDPVREVFDPSSRCVLSQLEECVIPA